MSRDLETRQDYQNEVKSTAKIIIDEFKNYDDLTLTELIWETVDSHQWMIYSGYHIDVIKHSSTKLEHTDWKSFFGYEDYSWRDVMQAMAFAVFESDVSSKVQELKANV